MSQNRRTFIKEAAIAGAVVCVSPTGVRAAEAGDSGEMSQARCPYFDQPLTCDGPDGNGVYRCDT